LKKVKKGKGPVKKPIGAGNIAAVRDIANLLLGESLT